MSPLTLVRKSCLVLTISQAASIVVDNAGGPFGSNDQISFSVATVTSLIGRLNIWKSLCVLQLLLTRLFHEFVR
jgi:hypothetical protein